MSDRVVPATLDAIMELRVAVLRQGTPVQHCEYPEDSFADVVHLAIERNGTVVATSSWFTKECPHRVGVAAVQLKGMAVLQTLQGDGLGARLIDAGIEEARQRRASIVWARARDSAIAFYERCGFTAVGDGFIDEPTGMPHHIVVRSV